MEIEEICFPEPLGCFDLPAQPPWSIQGSADDEEDEESLLSESSLAASLREQDPEGCFLCIAEELGEED